MAAMDRVFYGFSKALCWTFFKLYNRLNCGNPPKLPEGPVIVASNHCSNLDPVLVGVAFPRRLRYLAKGELFSIPVLGSIIKALGAVPVSRDDSLKRAAVLKKFIEFLQDGQSVLIFPEGGRSQDGKLQPLEAGVAYLAIKCCVPIVPAYVRGSHLAMPPGSSRIKPVRMSVSFGPLLDPLNFLSLSPNEARRRLLEQLIKELKTLGGEM
jgi:1-acyl-sn-glycerol-3-phosphate acyltransferase